MHCIYHVIAGPQPMAKLPGLHFTTVAVLTVAFEEPESSTMGHDGMYTFISNSLSGRR